MKTEISIVIPAYNEEPIIENTVRAVTDYFREKELNFEIIVVDDGSKDNTWLKLEKLKIEIPALKIIRHETNLGKGRSVKDGILSAEGELILFTDADLSAPLTNLNRMEEEIKKGYSIVVGSRYVKGAVIKKRPLIRQILGKGFNILLKLLRLTDIKDTQCGFKLFKKEAAKDIFSEAKIYGYAFDVEILYLAKLKGYEIAECPILWIDRSDSKMKLIRDAIRMFKEVVMIKHYYG